MSQSLLKIDFDATMQRFARAELSKRAFFTLEQMCKKLACSNLKKTGKEEEQSAAYYSFRIFVTIDVELVVILVIDLLIFTKLCISSVSCTCLVQDHFRPSEVSIFGSGRDNK